MTRRARPFSKTKPFTFVVTSAWYGVGSISQSVSAVAAATGSAGAPFVFGDVSVPARPAVAEALCAEVLSLPVHPGLAPGDVEAIVAGVRSFYDRS